MWSSPIESVQKEYFARDFGYRCRNWAIGGKHFGIRQNRTPGQHPEINWRLQIFYTILSPIRRLDDLAVIFTHCLATHRNPTMNVSEAPIHITHICSAWRSIALSIPRLWSRFHMYLFNPEEWRHWYRYSEEEVQRWLRLSAACPLSIIISSLWEDDVHQPHLDAIVRSSRHWQQLEFRYLATYSKVWKMIINLSVDDLGMLRDLRFHSMTNLWHKSVLSAAKGLCSIHINKIELNAFPTGIPQNWQNLNHLFIHSPILIRVANQLLNHCHNPITCLLEVATEKSDSDSTLLSSSLPHLTFLSLEAFSTGCNHIFHYIDAPSLQILDCRGYFLDESEGSGLYDFLQRINPLTTLAIDHEYLTMKHIFKCGTLIPSLKHLVLGRTNPLPVKLMSTLYEIKHQ